MSENVIRIQGARQHNLKNISLELPRDRLVVITGVSGSGKSSLAFDTLYAEGQRRYVESLSAYARQFLEQMDKPDVDSIEGLSPAIAIEQKSAGRNPRSTVATVTEIYDYLRVLFARAGEAHCHSCGKPITRMSIQQMCDRVLGELPQDERFMVIAPIVRGRKGEYRKEFERFRKDGWSRVRVDGRLYDLSSEEIELDRNLKHDIEIVVDRLTVKPGAETQLSQSLEHAAQLADGLVLIETRDGGRMTFSEKYACPDCGVSLPEISPRLFSFNNPHGACPECHGLGMKIYFDPELVVPDENLSVNEGAIAAWNSASGFMYKTMLSSACAEMKIDMDRPWRELPEKQRKTLLYGLGDKRITYEISRENEHYKWNGRFEGVITNLERRYRDTQSEYIREEFERYMSYRVCPSCKGLRLRPEALHVLIDGRSIIDVTHMSAGDCLRYFSELRLDARRIEIAARVLKEIRERLKFLVNVGLDYLSLDRASATLSGGESQRIRLATQIGSSLVGVMYILDEPSIGLHQRDNRRLLETLMQLRDQGNTVIVVEHDEDTIRSADFVVDMGPGAGVHGGEVVFAGKPAQLERKRDSLTGGYMSGRLEIAVPARRRKSNGQALKLCGCTANNLKNIDVEIPLGVFTCITGVSGSGKSSLLIDTLLPTLEAHAAGRPRLVNCRKAEGLEFVKQVISIDQSPIGRTPRSNPATYTGLFGPIRELFAKVPEARARGYAPGRFSFNVKGGRCETCEGAGVIKIEMHFLPDVFVQCEACGGKRYNRDTLDVKYRGHSISDVLDMTVDEAHELFENVPQLHNKLATLRDVGLGYIALGQSATTLSGGEAQRIKLTKELSKRSGGNTLYVLDEPTTGLHFDDIRRLLEVLNRLVEMGNSVLVIEHNLDVIKTADHIIDMGPEGGLRGGEVTACGTPEEVAAAPASHTGGFLKEKLGLQKSKSGKGKLVK